MEKKMINVHAINVHIYQIAIIILLIIVVALAFKWIHLDLAVKDFTKSTIWINSQKNPNVQVADYGEIIGASAAEYVSSKDLQSYIEDLSKSLGRDIAVVDKEKVILADSNPLNVGTVYNFDSQDEIEMTILDGQARTFEETSEDFPSGITQVAVPMRESDGDIIGAVIISNTKIK